MGLETKGLYILKDDDYVPYNLPMGKVILCGVPGAFTPGCTKRHLPGFAKNLDKLKDKGIEATIKLSESPNSKVIVIGSGKSGMPIILGNQ